MSFLRLPVFVVIHAKNLSQQAQHVGLSILQQRLFDVLSVNSHQSNPAKEVIWGVITEVRLNSNVCRAYVFFTLSDDAMYLSELIEERRKA